MRFFVDRSIGGRILVEAVSQAGHHVIAHDSIFPQTADDEHWIQYAVEQNLIFITKDKMIRKRPNELAALRAASLRVIVLVSGDTRMADYAQKLVVALPVIETLLNRTPPPVLIRFTSTGDAAVIPADPIRLSRRKFDL